MVSNTQMVTAMQPASGLGSGKIDHVVIIVKENHTFDDYLGTFPGANGMTMPRSPNPPPPGPGPSPQCLANPTDNLCLTAVRRG